MGGDVPERPGRAALGRVGPPAGLLLVGLLQRVPQPALDVVAADRLDLAQLPAQAHLPGLPDQRVAGVVVHQGEHAGGVLDDLHQPFGLVVVERHRLVADDVEPGLEHRPGDLEVRVVRRGDGDEVDPLRLRQRGFLLHQFVNAGVRAVVRDRVAGGGLLRPLRVRGEGPGDDLRPVVQHRGGGVDPADERPGPAAHQGHPQLAVQGAVCGGEGGVVGVGGHGGARAGGRAPNATARRCGGAKHWGGGAVSMPAASPVPRSAPRSSVRCPPPAPPPP